MKDNTFQAHRRGEEGGELSQAEWPGEKWHQSEAGESFKEKIKAALNSADGNQEDLSALVLALCKERLVKAGKEQFWWNVKRRGPTRRETPGNSAVSWELGQGWAAEANRFYFIDFLWGYGTLSQGGRKSQGQRNTEVRDWIMWGHQDELRVGRRTIQNSLVPETQKEVGKVR